MRRNARNKVKRRTTKRSHNTPLSQTSISKRDYLDEDPIIPSQKFCALSMAMPTNDMVSDVVVEISRKNHVNQQMTQRLIDDWEDMISSRRAFKVRGSYQSQQEAEQRCKDVQDFDMIHHVFVGEVGKWLKFGESAENIAEQEWQSTELNSLMKGHAEQKVKTTKHFEERRRRMMEEMIVENEEDDDTDKKDDADGDDNEIPNEAMSDMIHWDAKIEALKYELSEAEATFAELHNKWPSYERKPEFRNVDTNPLVSRMSTRMT